ncbi:hypothetical protein [Luteolibacter soli]|uniref:Uncharacterized protein n=1 Tax=Luteolibacter soli TaxID=3135280 RepID=A0ABU9APC3_9BACT
MAKEIVVVPQGQEESLFSSLLELGFTFVNPASEEISGWSEEGRQVFLDIDAGLDAFRIGVGIQVWRGAGNDLNLVRDFEEETIRVWLDGWSAEESAEIMSHLSGSGIVFEIDYD